MESMNKKNLRTCLVVEEDVNLSAFRRRNNIIILILICFILSLALIIGSLIFYTVHITSESDQPIPLNPAIQAYYSVACNTPSCLNIFSPIVSAKSITDPNQIFTLSLQTAANEIENLTSFMHSNSDTESAFKNCSASLRDGSGQILAALATMRVNPLVETLSNDQRIEIVNRIITAEEDLKSCLDDLAKAESTAASEVREKVHRVMVHVSGGDNFLAMHDVVLQKFWSDMAAAHDHSRREILENVVIVCICGLYLWCIFYFLRALCRFIGVKSLPLGNAFRAWVIGTAISRR